MPSASTGFTIRETHGILSRPGNEIEISSDKVAWPSLYASLQREVPFEDSFKAVPDHLIVLHLDGPVMVHRRIPNGESSRLIAPGGMFMMPGGMDFGVRLSGTLADSSSLSPACAYRGSRAEHSAGRPRSP